MIHKETHPQAGTTVKIAVDLKTTPPIAKGTEYVLEDWWDRVTGKSWMISDGNIAAMIYGIRSGTKGLPLDDEVVYGKVGGLGHLVHVSELEL